MHCARSRAVLLSCSLTLALLTLLFFTVQGSAALASVDSQERAGLDIVLLIDNSRSMLRTDQLGLRVEAARLFVDYLRAAAPSALVPRISVISFSGEIGSHVGLLPAEKEEVQSTIKSELGEYTDFPLALSAAYQALENGGTFIFGRQAVIILLTDGRPCTEQLDIHHDRCDKTPEEFIIGHFEDSITPEVQKLNESGVKLYVLGLGKIVQPDAERWKTFAQQTGGSYVPVLEAGALFSAYRGVLKDLLPSKVEGPQPIELGVTTLDVYPPYLESATFTFLQADLTAGAPTTRSLSLAGPTGPIAATPGRVVHAGSLSGGRYEIYSLVEPPAGLYTATLTGTNGVKVWLDAVPPTLDVFLISGPIFIGGSVEFAASLLRHGRPVTEPLEMEALIRFPSGKEEHLGMQDPDQDGVFIGTLEATLEGDYDITAVARVAGREAGRREVAAALTVSALPEIRSIYPSPERPEAGQAIAISIEVARPELLRQPIVILEVFSDTQTVVSQTVPGKDGLFHHTLSGLPAGAYRLRVTIPARAMPAGACPMWAEMFFEVLALPPTPAPTPTPTPTPKPARPSVELGPIVVRPPQPRHGDAVSITVPVRVSGPIALTGAWHEMWEESQLLTKTASTTETNGVVSNLGTMSCRGWGAWLNLVPWAPCSSYEMVEDIQFAGDENLNLSVYLSTLLSLQRPLWVSWALALLEVAVLAWVVYAWVPTFRLFTAWLVWHFVRVLSWPLRRILQGVWPSAAEWLENRIDQSFRLRLVATMVAQATIMQREGFWARVKRKPPYPDIAIETVSKRLPRLEATMEAMNDWLIRRIMSDRVVRLMAREIADLVVSPYDDEWVIYQFIKRAKE